MLLHPRQNKINVKPPDDENMNHEQTVIEPT